MVVWDPWNSSVSVSSFDLGLQQMAALPSSKTSLQSIPRFILRTHQHDGGFTYSLTHSWDILGPWDYFPWNIILFKTYFPWFMNYPHYIVSPFFSQSPGNSRPSPHDPEDIPFAPRRGATRFLLMPVSNLYPRLGRTMLFSALRISELTFLTAIYHLPFL